MAQSCKKVEITPSYVHRKDGSFCVQKSSCFRFTPPPQSPCLGGRKGEEKYIKENGISGIQAPLLRQ